MKNCLNFNNYIFYNNVIYSKKQKSKIKINI